MGTDRDLLLDPFGDCEPLEEYDPGTDDTEVDGARLTRRLHQLAWTVNKTDQYAQDIKGTMSPGALLQLAQACKLAEDTLSQTRRELEARVVDLLPVGAVIGDATVEWGSRWRAVEREQLVAAIVARVSDEPGVVLDAEGTRLPIHEIARNLARRLNECISFGAPKVTGLKPLGLDADEYAEKVEGPKVTWKKTT